MPPDNNGIHNVWAALALLAIWHDSKQGSKATTQTHAMKAHPWTVRLAAGTAALKAAIKSGNRAGMIDGIEDTSFWVGRIICDAIGSVKNGDQSAGFQKGATGVIEAQKAIIKAKGLLKKRGSASTPPGYSLPEEERKKLRRLIGAGFASDEGLPTGLQAIELINTLASMEMFNQADANYVFSPLAVKWGQRPGSVGFPFLSVDFRMRLLQLLENIDWPKGSPAPYRIPVETDRASHFATARHLSGLSNPEKRRLNLKRLLTRRFGKFPKDRNTALPHQIGLLHGVGTLNLSGNALIELPESLGLMTTLEDLIVAQNQLTKLPESLGKLTQLRWVQVQNNSLTKLPKSVSGWTALESINASLNDITTVPDSLFRIRPKLADGLAQMAEGVSKQGQPWAGLPDDFSFFWGSSAGPSTLVFSVNHITNLPESFWKWLSYRTLDDIELRFEFNNFSRTTLNSFVAKLLRIMHKREKAWAAVLAAGGASHPTSKKGRAWRLSVGLPALQPSLTFSFGNRRRVGSWWLGLPESWKRYRSRALSDDEISYPFIEAGWSGHGFSRPSGLFVEGRWPGTVIFPEFRDLWETWFVESDEIGSLQENLEPIEEAMRNLGGKGPGSFGTFEELT